MLFITVVAFSQNYQEIPEFVFSKPVLVSGIPKKDGAVYRFNNIAPGYDATVTILGRSSQTVILDTIDVPGGGNMGFDKALQPQLGIPGWAPANSNWWMKFQMNFLKAGTNDPVSLDKFTTTALDIDGDGASLGENLIMYKANSMTFSAPTYLQQTNSGSVACPLDGIISYPKNCSHCLGHGYTLDVTKKLKCATCNGAGFVFSSCVHPWSGSDMAVQGPVINGDGIDTSTTRFMVTFTYTNVSSITFQYGAKTGYVITNAGERLNSMWFKAFSLGAPTSLPVKLSGFNAKYDQKTVNLNWTTSYEENFSHFVIQRSIDGFNYSDIALVFAYGNSNQLMSYKYKDDIKVICSTGLVYYRLHMMEKIGESSYSEIRIIRLGEEKAGRNIYIFPNPARDELRITLPGSWQGKSVQLELISCNGTRVQMVQTGNTSQTETLKLTNVAKGLYIIKATCQNETTSQKVLKE